MRIIVQNVNYASCKIDGKIVGEIQRGFCVFVGFAHDDTKERVEKMANKLVSLRLFDDENGKTNLSLNLPYAEARMKAISELCGFNDQSYFSKQFKKAENVTCLAFRRRWRD